MGIRDFIHRYDVALLSAEPAELPTKVGGSGSIKVEWLSEQGSILKAHAALGHRVSDAMLERRLFNRLRFAVFSLDGEPVASSWLASGGRYIDELNWWLPIATDELWVRDVFVAPAWRGRRLFAALVATLSGRAVGPGRRIWSDVDWDNAPSMKAHKAAGFAVVARVRALDFGGRLRLRSALPAWPLPVLEMDPESHWVWLHGDRLKRHRELLA